jgi:glycosyltransferase involved in cell wall biosynthesis
VITAFNYERYVGSALRSVLDQDYPPGQLDVVVIDDGSTDGTADAVQEVRRIAPARVRLIRQPNRGLAAATGTALAAATGELIAICDSDDTWLPGKVREQAAVLAARPEVALVYGDMQVIDPAGGVLDNSFFRRLGITPLRGRVLDQLVDVNFTTNSTLMFRARDVVPIPPASPFADYWIALNAAAAGELEVLERPLAQYRLHGANMSFGASDRGHRDSVSRMEVAFSRLTLTGPLGDAVGTAALAAAAVRVGHQVNALLASSQGATTAPEQVVPVSAAQRAGAAAELRRAVAVDGEPAVRAAARAVLLDPLSAEACAELERLRAPAACGS